MDEAQHEIAGELRRREVLDVLLADYVQGREDDRTFLLIIGTLFAVGIPLVAAASQWIFKSCSATTLASGSCQQNPQWTFVFVPLLPLLLIGLFALNAAAAVMRSYYLRALEQKLEEYGGSLTFGDPSQERAVKSPSLVRVLIPMVSHRRGVFPHAFVQTGLYVIVALLGVGVGVAALWRVENLQLQIAGGVFYGACLTVVIMIAVRSGLEARRFFDDLLTRHLTRPAEFEPDTGERSLGSYLFIPRPLDIVKFTFVVGWIAVSYGIGASAGRPSIGVLVAFVLAFELLVYHARYMRNDFNDLSADPDHPMARAKRRPPRLDARPDRLVLFEGVFALRLILALAFGAWLFLTGHTRLGWVYSIGSVAAWLVGDIYERIKDRAKTETHAPWRRERRHLALYVWVGIGYALRSIVGASIGSNALGQNWHSIAAVALILAWGILFGSMFVAMTWALEASAFVTKDQTAYDGGLSSRGHIAVLGAEARLLEDLHCKDHAIDNPQAPGRQKVKVLLPRGASSDLWLRRPKRWSTWNISYTAAMVLAGLLGFVVASGWQPTGRAYAVALAAGVISAATAAAAVQSRLPPWTHFLIAAAAMVTVPFAAKAVDAQHAFLAGVLIAAVACCYGAFLGTSYYELMHPEELWSAIALLGGAFLERIFLGNGLLQKHLEETVGSAVDQPKQSPADGGALPTFGE
jgi:hypothetical protein